MLLFYMFRYHAPYHACCGYASHVCVSDSNSQARFLCAYARTCRPSFDMCGHAGDRNLCFTFLLSAFWFCYFAFVVVSLHVFPTYCSSSKLFFRNLPYSCVLLCPYACVRRLIVCADNVDACGARACLHLHINETHIGLTATFACFMWC